MPTSTHFFARQLLRWYDEHRRELPWRSPKGQQTSVPPYFVLVSEFMLQQTQVVTVIPYFQRFLTKFPTISDLADAPPEQVLRLWQGLGYYSRARNLHATARKIAAEFAGEIPRRLQDLRQLPGVGRYTAGAIGSIAFNLPVPVVDGNVARVLCRLEKISGEARRPAAMERLWKLAKQNLDSRRPGDFNSAMMELGATVCLPRSPKCDECPLHKICRARKAGLQNSIPPIRCGKPTPLMRRLILCLHHNGRYLIEQRPDSGRWAGMWQFVTIEAGDKPPTAATLRSSLGLGVTNLTHLGEIRHALTHRRYIFDVYTGHVEKNGDDPPRRRWLELAELDAYPLPRPQVRVIDMLRQSRDSR